MKIHKFLKKKLDKKIRQSRYLLQKRINTLNKQHRKILKKNTIKTHEMNIPHTKNVNTMDQTTKNQMDKKKCY